MSHSSVPQDPVSPQALRTAAIYARVSTEDQGKGYSIPTQIAACQELARREGSTVPDSHVFVDDGVSGATLDRSSLRKLRTLVRARAVAALVVYDPDRLSRTLGHLLLLIEELAQSGVTLLVVSHPIEHGAEGTLFFQLRGAMAEFERAKLHERTERGRLGRARAGHVWGGSVAFGYTAIREPHKAHWEMNKEEAEIVQRIFQLCLSGLSSRAIARLLTQEGVPTCLDRRRSAGRKTLPVGAWQPASVHRILSYEPYCTGVAYFNKRQTVTRTTRTTRPAEEWIALTVPTIITRVTFDAAQHQLAVNKVRSPRNRKRPYLLSGRFHCGRCGRVMSGYLAGKHRRYRCGSVYDLHAETCRGTVLADEVEARVWAAVECVLRQPELIAAEVTRQHAHADDERAAIEHEINLCSQVLSRCDREAQRWAQAYAGEVISMEELRQYRAEIETRRQSILEQLRAYQARLAGIAQALDHAETLTAYCRHVAEQLRTFDMTEKQLALDALDIRVTWMQGQEISVSGSIPMDVVEHIPSR